MAGIKKTQGINGTALLQDLDFTYNTTDNKGYSCSFGDPNTHFYNIEICYYSNVVSGTGNNVTIDNLCLKYAGVSGVDYGGGTGSHNRDDDMIKYDEKILDTTIGLDDNTFIFFDK